MAKKSQFYYNSRYTIPLMLGLIVGFALSLIFMPFFECDDTLFMSSSSETGENYKIDEQTGKLVKVDKFSNEAVQQQLDDFEPRINLNGKPRNPKKTPAKIVRPRYAATELGIREKLFVAVLTTIEKLSTLALVTNETVSPHVNKLVFFVNNLNVDEKAFQKMIPRGLSVISFNDNHEILKPFHTIKYILDHHIANYDWFMLVEGTTFIRGEKLVNLLNHVSITQDLYFGYSENDVYCSLNSGIIFSNSILSKLADKMDWCTNNAYSSQATDNIGRCILHSTNLGCTSTASGRDFEFYAASDFKFDSEIDKLRLTRDFNASLTVHPVRDVQTMQKLQLYFNYVDIEEIRKEISSIEKDIVETACYTPEGCNGLTWPLGVPAPFTPTNRHDVIRWDYFNETHIYFEGDFDVVNELTDDYKLDVDEVLAFSMKKLNEPSPDRYQYDTLLNGYKQFDPTRGASYILDLQLWDNTEQRSIHKRVNVMRPLGLVELVPMPYVTENAKITLVVVFSMQYDSEQIDAFFRKYEKNVLQINEVADKMNLHLVYAKLSDANNTTNPEMRAKIEETIQHVQRVIGDLEKKYSSITTSSSRITQTYMHVKNVSLYYSEGYLQLSAIELLSPKLPLDTLIMVSPPGVDFQSEFLNRVRLNTIKDNQIFFPVAFYQYNPVIINEPPKQPDEIEINKNVGYFNIYSYEFSSFYNKDFNTTRGDYMKIHGMKPNQMIADSVLDLYELFISNKHLHLLRAPDQALKCRWMLIRNCEKRRNADEVNRCQLQIEHGLGNRAQLAMYLMNMEKKNEKVEKLS